ncbi:MAG: hypothetical protein GQ574_14415 [Crocinitomix sp.]|nr:hypothetical protein [Crocinitomix sp.]
MLTILLCLTFCACAGSETGEFDLNVAEDLPIMVVSEEYFSYESDVIPIGEHIDGPANVRDEEGGELIFELYDNAVVQIADDKGDWVRISTHYWLEGEDYQSEVIKANTILYDQNKNAFGKVLVECMIYLTQKSETEGYAYIEGYTHQDNIRQESLIENDLVRFVTEKGREQDVFKSFIQKYKMRSEKSHLDYDGVYIYENWITDPSPGYRINLLFKAGELKGVFHSRDLHIANTKTYDLGRMNFRVSFFYDYPEEEQQKYVDYMSDWLQSVD